MKHATQKQIDSFVHDWLMSRELVRTVNLKVMQQEELSATLFTVLNLLDLEQAVSAVELAARMNVHPSTIVRNLDTLEEQKLIGRRRNPADRRELQITLAAKGLKLRDRLRAAFVKRIGEVLEQMTEGARDALVYGYHEFVKTSDRIITAASEKEIEHEKR
jgi:DNA-binding MarR family transcriptional regulator